jgi:ketosteroid isomerase-like protein
MNEQENTRIVQQVYENFKNQDISALLDSFSEDIDWQLPEMESVPFSGKHKGRTEAARFFQSLAEAQDVITFNPQEFITQGDKVVVLGDYSWRVKSTNKEFGSDWAHVWTVRDGKLAGFKEYTDTAAASNAHQKAVGA